MITEKGTIVVETDINAPMLREFVRKPFILSLVALIVGLAGILAYMGWDISTLWTHAQEPSTWILVGVSVPFAFGLIFVISFRRVGRTLVGPPKKEIYELYSNYLVAEDFAGGEKVATAKIYYNQIVKRKETKNYIFFYIRQTNACPLSKAGLSEEELKVIRSLFGARVQGELAITLAEGNDEIPTGIIAGALSSDPFSELFAPKAPDQKAECVPTENLSQTAEINENAIAGAEEANGGDNDRKEDTDKDKKEDDDKDIKEDNDKENG